MMFKNLIVLIYQYKSRKNSMKDFYLSISVALPWHKTGASGSGPKLHILTISSV